MKMKKVLSIALSIVMLIGMTTSGFAATAPKSTTVKKVTAPVAPVFKILGDFEFGLVNNEMTDKYIQISFYEDKLIRLREGLNKYTDIIYTKAVPGKVVVKGTTVWDFTATIELEEGEQPPKQVKGVVSITFKDNKNILSVKMPKVNGVEINIKQPLKLIEMPVDNGRDGFYGDENYQVGVDDADKSIMLIVPKENKRYEMVYTKAAAGKVVTKGTTVWVFTGACKMTTTGADETEIVSKPWNTTITVTYKNRDTVVGVDLAKTAAQPAVSFKGEITNDGGGY